MSIENNLERIADALEALVQICSTTGPVDTPPVQTSPDTTPDPFAQKVGSEVSTPFVETKPVLEPKIPVPFTDGPGLIAYATEVYRRLGAADGVKIQEIITGLGYTSIHDIKAEDYPAFFTQVEALGG